MTNTAIQREYEYRLADLLEDETLRVYEGFYLNNEGELDTQVSTLYQLILHSITAFDALILVSNNDEDDTIGEIARDWLLDYGQGYPDTGRFFSDRLIDRIEQADYTLKEG